MFQIKTNTLLTRYPICFIHGLKSVFVFYNYWNHIPEYLKEHGYDVYEFKANWRGPNETRLKQWSEQLSEVLEKHDKVHLIAHSLGTLNGLELVQKTEFQDHIASLTCLSPVFGGTPWAELAELKFFRLIKPLQGIRETLTPEAATQILKNFKKPKSLLLTAILSHPKEKSHPTLRVQRTLLKEYLKRKGFNEVNDGLVPLDSQRIAYNICDKVFEFEGDHRQIIGPSAHQTLLNHCIFLAEHDLVSPQ